MSEDARLTSGGFRNAILLAAAIEALVLIPLFIHLLLHRR
jgi:hypothetical protein